MKVEKQHLQRFSPFDCLSDEYLASVRARVSVREFHKGDLLFQRGKRLSETFYLLKGSVDLVAADLSRLSVGHNAPQAKHPLCNTEPARVSAFAKTDVQVLVIDWDFLDLVMAWSESSQVDSSSLDLDLMEAESSDSDWMSMLLSAPLFRRIPPGNIQTLFQRFVPRRVKAEEEVVSVGTKGDYFYVIKSGSARVVDSAGYCRATLNRGDYFGEEALIGDTSRNATVEMLDDGELMCLGKESFAELLHDPLVNYVSVAEFFRLQESGRTIRLLDVRLPLEFKQKQLAGSTNIPLSYLRAKLTDLPTDVLYVVSDYGGRRSEVAVQLMV
ncbi:MAG: cyclic nucleotide-binding domain-containing protein, partial [Cellvibrionaceae bacterium]|nr:cyclic nucleotide-binding domain-containing protein [Cellvibrionaceae bacterium]